VPADAAYADAGSDMSGENKAASDAVTYR